VDPYFKNPSCAGSQTPGRDEQIKKNKDLIQICKHEQIYDGVLLNIGYCYSIGCQNIVSDQTLQASVGNKKKDELSIEMIN
jgi:hypothetical protein